MSISEDYFGGEFKYDKKDKYSMMKLVHIPQNHIHIGNLTSTSDLEKGCGIYG